MPGGNGIDLIRNLAQLPPPHPLFFTCSGYSDLNEIQAIRNLVAGQFEKPFRSTAVIAEIRKALDSKTAI